jgi:phosphoribulokinase
MTRLIGIATAFLAMIIEAQAMIRYARDEMDRTIREAEGQ